MNAIPADEDEPGFVALLEKISRERRFACASYKDKCVRRRIAVRLRACRLSSYREYARYLDANPDEWDRLLATLTINVTKFFRNPDAFAAVAETVIPWAWSDLPVRIWSAGCASGEEAWSLAVLLHQHARVQRSLHRLSRMRVLGTDVDPASLAAAERGEYAARAFDETSPETRREYFSDGDPATIDPVLRPLVRFERHDLLGDAPPDGPFHLIVCRNVMIYFDRPTQDRLIEAFYAALVPGGYLLLGSTETLLGPARHDFSVVRQRERLYRKR